MLLKSGKVSFHTMTKIKKPNLSNDVVDGCCCFQALIAWFSLNPEADFFSCLLSLPQRIYTLSALSFGDSGKLCSDNCYINVWSGWMLVACINPSVCCTKCFMHFWMNLVWVTLESLLIVIDNIHMRVVSNNFLESATVLEMCNNVQTKGNWDERISNLEAY